MHASKHACIQACMHARMYVYIEKYTCTCSYIIIGIITTRCRPDSNCQYPLRSVKVSDTRAGFGSRDLNVPRMLAILEASTIGEYKGMQKRRSYSYLYTLGPKLSAYCLHTWSLT